MVPFALAIFLVLLVITVSSNSIDDDYELYAVVGGGICAESLPYGPSSITTAGTGSYSRYVCTNTQYGSLQHDEWLQIVTSDGVNELFRIYWTFDTPRTLANHFITAVSSGVNVNYHVVDTSGVGGGAVGADYFYTGVWRFSNTAGITSSTFATTYTVTSRFSADDGAWGAGSVTINANGYSWISNYWGVGNLDSSDSSDCTKVWVNGNVYGYYSLGRTYMYLTKNSSSSMYPSFSPSIRPSTVAPTSRAPTLRPTTSVPSQRPSTLVPTLRPTFPVGSGKELFAIVGYGQCAEYLYYGPSSLSTSGSSDGYSYYFSTSTIAGSVAHQEWLQIVTSDGVNELFRIYWTFSTAKTLSDRFSSAVRNGESVSYRIFDTTGVGGTAGTEYTYNNAVWWFSDSAGITSTKFAVTQTTWGFSSDDGAWGAGSGTVNADGVTYISNFWGVGNLDGGDTAGCGNIYVNGVVYRTSLQTKSFMFVVTGTADDDMFPFVTNGPSRVPTAAPSTRVPTASPTTTAAPTTTSAPSLAPPYELFAIVGGSECAELLYYGPSSISESGSSDGYTYYFSTSTTYGKMAHTEWVQIVSTTSSSSELFRIYWTFSSAKTLSNRFVNAVQYGEIVSYRVVDTAGVAGVAGAEYTYNNAVWWFSDTASITSAKFTTTYTARGFSSDDGAWGAGSSTVNADGVSIIANFWGVANLDSSDASVCGNIYVNGYVSTRYTGAKSYLYVVKSSATGTVPASPTTKPTQRPTQLSTQRPSSLRPTAAPSSRRPTLRPVTLSPSRFPTLQPSERLYPVINVETQLTLSNVQVTMLSTTESNLIVNVTATLLHLTSAEAQDSIFVVSVASHATHSPRHDEQPKQQVQQQQTIVSLWILVDLIKYPEYSYSADTAYQTVTDTLSTALNSGSFSQTLQQQAVAYNTPTFTAASVTGLSSTYSIYASPPTRQPSSAPGLAESVSDFFTPTVILIVVVVGGGVLAMCLAASVYYCCCVAKNNSDRDNERDTSLDDVEVNVSSSSSGIGGRRRQHQNVSVGGGFAMDLEMIPTVTAEVTPGTPYEFDKYAAVDAGPSAPPLLPQATALENTVSATPARHVTVISATEVHHVL